MPDIQVYVCHKCGLPRKVVPIEAETPSGNKIAKSVDLGGCTCLGQTWFLYEDTPRTVEQAVEIARQSYLTFSALYIQQKREDCDFGKLARTYAKALTWKP